MKNDVTSAIQQSFLHICGVSLQKIRSIACGRK